MTAKDKAVIRILFFLAKVLARTEWQKELESLATHVTYTDFKDIA